MPLWLQTLFSAMSPCLVFLMISIPMSPAPANFDYGALRSSVSFFFMCLFCFRTVSPLLTARSLTFPPLPGVSKLGPSQFFPISHGAYGLSGFPFSPLFLKWLLFAPRMCSRSKWACPSFFRLRFFLCSPHSALSNLKKSLHSSPPLPLFLSSLEVQFFVPGGVHSPSFTRTLKAIF